MSMLDDDLDVNESDLLAKICLRYFEKYGYWNDNSIKYQPIYPCTIDSIYLHSEFNEKMKTPE